MASAWDHERDKQLLVAILAVHSPLDFAKIAKEMGQGDSSAAVRQHIYALKARKEGGGQSPTKNKAEKPAGRGRKTTKTTSKRKPAAESQDGDGDGDESSGSSTKQRKL
ncbi:unnamed protein product [Penicillium glandicola]